MNYVIFRYQLNGDQAHSTLCNGGSPFRLNRSRILYILLLILFFIFALYQICYHFAGEDIQSWSNRVLPIILILSLSSSMYLLLRIQPILILSPLLWFFAACALYFGLGPLIYHYGDQISIWYVHQYYYVGESDLLRTNLLNTSGISLVIVAFLLGSKLFKIPYLKPTKLPGLKTFKKITLFLLIIGSVIKYLLYLPYVFGLTDFILPGSIMQLQTFVILSTIPMIIMIKNGMRKWFPILILVICSELFVSLMEFSKISFVMALIIPFIGLFVVNRRMYLVCLGVMLILGSYYFIFPIADYGRLELTKIHGIFFRGNFQERYEILKRYFLEKSSINNMSIPGHQSWWTRLNYANAQTFAMDQYDSGQRGTTFSLAIYTIIPRIIWKDKPVITEVGNVFNYLVTKNPDSASSPGIFAEAYWNGGWLAFFFACTYLGFLFAGFTKYSLIKIGKNEFYFLPIIILGIRIGIRCDGWFVSDYVGSLVIAIFMHLVLKVSFRKVRY